MFSTNRESVSAVNHDVSRCQILQKHEHFRSYLKWQKLYLSNINLTYSILWLFISVHVSSTNMEEVAIMTYTAASHHWVIKILWLHFWAADKSFFFMYSLWLHGMVLLCKLDLEILYPSFTSKSDALWSQVNKRFCSRGRRNVSNQPGFHPQIMKFMFLTSISSFIKLSNTSTVLVDSNFRKSQTKVVWANWPWL